LYPESDWGGRANDYPLAPEKPGVKKMEMAGRKAEDTQEGKVSEA